MEENVDEKTPWKPITRKELYTNFPYLKNLNLKDMIQLMSLCFKLNSDNDLVYAVKCYLHSYPELAKHENFEKVFTE